MWQEHAGRSARPPAASRDHARHPVAGTPAVDNVFLARQLFRPDTSRCFGARALGGGLALHSIGNIMKASFLGARGCAAAVLTAACLAIPTAALSDDAAANALFVEAVREYRAAQALDGDVRTEALRGVRAALDRILAEYSDSSVAARLRGEEAPAGMDLASLPAASPEERSDADCIAGRVGTPPARAMEILIVLDESGRVTGIPRLESPTDVDAETREDFLALTAALDACAPLRVAAAGAEVRVSVATDGIARVTQAAAPAPPPPETAELPPAPALTSATEAEERDMDLDRQTIRDLQARLLVSGFDPNGIDGVIGRGTRSALSAWQSGLGVAPTGYINAAQLAALRSVSEDALAAWLSDPENETLYLPPPPVALGPGNMGGNWRFTSTCGPDSRLGRLTITGNLDIRHAGGNAYRGSALQSQGFRGRFSGRLEGRRVSGEINWGLLVGRVSFSGRIADQELVMRGSDSNGCGFYAVKR